MSTFNLSKPQATFELALWQAEADSISSSDLYLWLRNSGLPPEVAIRLKDFTNVTREIIGKTFSLGKVVVLKLIDFIKAHPNMAVGIALGAALSLLAATIPFIGSMLVPIAAQLGITLGALAGHRMDKATDGQLNGSTHIVDITQDAIEIARLFFQFFIDTCLALADEFQKDSAP